MYKWLATLFTDKNLYRICLVIIAAGILLRIAFYGQNRCLFIDEANVARNIYERSFSGLTHPLSYEQYAPPLFLWLVKSCTILLGYHEMAFRLFSMICGVAALLLMHRALLRFSSPKAAWYPLFIMATGFIYIRYAAELKQYMCDVAVVLGLLLLALRCNALQMSQLKFFILWAFIGSLTIWLSMPGVFMLAGVMAYHAYSSFIRKKWSLLPLLFGIGIIWLAQFALYYKVILASQIKSSYLQDFHKDFFLFALPRNMNELSQNVEVLTKLMAAMGGKWATTITLHVAAFIIGIVYLFKKQLGLLILVATPLFCAFVATAAHQYALTPRLALFLMPLLLLLIASGLQQMMKIRFIAVKVVVLIAAAITMVNFNSFQLFWQRMDNEEITASMNFLKRKDITGFNLYVDDLARPAYIYYTTIHPRKDEWMEISDAHLLDWNCNYDSLGRIVQGKFGMLYCWATDAEISNAQVELQRSNHLVADTVVSGSRAYIYGK